MSGRRAIVRGARMFKDTYASVKVKQWQLHRNEGNMNLNIDLKNEPIVHGWVLTATEDLWEDKLTLFDRIEGYDCNDEERALYLRRVVEIELLKVDSNDNHVMTNGRIIDGMEGDVISGYIYIRPDALETEPIPSGDWMKRNRGGNDNA